MGLLRKLKKVTFYCLYLLAIVILTDVILLRKVLHFGYPRHFNEENIQRFPTPYIEFKGRPMAGDHNEWGFRGPSFDIDDTAAYKIAFFGGSTGYYGEPPIPTIVGTELQKLSGKKIFVANFSVISSSQRQHAHEMLEFLPNFKPDIIVFYGGYNETMQQAICDPRPGYPYNFYYRRELSSFRKLLLEYSAVVGEIDKRTGGVSGLATLQERYKPYSNTWNHEIVEYYFETNRIANNLRRAFESNKFVTPKFFSFYQPFQFPDSFKVIHQNIRDRIRHVPYMYDLSALYDPLTKKIYKDVVHVYQSANQLMGDSIAHILFNSVFYIKNK